MKICWDNLEKVRYNPKTGTFRYNNMTYYEYDVCLHCGESFLGQKNRAHCDSTCVCRSTGWRKKQSILNSGINNPNYKGGIVEKI